MGCLGGGPINCVADIDRNISDARISQCEGNSICSHAFAFDRTHSPTFIEAPLRNLARPWCTDELHQLVVLLAIWFCELVLC